MTGDFSLLDRGKGRCHHADEILLRGAPLSLVQDFIGNRHVLVCEPLLPLIAQQAAQADSTRSVAPAVINAIKQTDIPYVSYSQHRRG